MAEPTDKPQRADAVNWLSFNVLWPSALRSKLSKKIGEVVDRRENFAALNPNESPIRLAYGSDETVWVDYVADVGDGHRASINVAARVNVDLPGLDPHEEGDHEEDAEVLERGSILLFGGDQVYPTASAEEYDRRFKVPYESPTSRETDTPVDGRKAVFALPGNHDWYDGLTSFYSVFCTGDYGGHQRLPYWAVRLENVNWDIVGIDFGLTKRIDEPQRAYFEGWKARYEKQDWPSGIVVCVAEPFWEKDESGTMAAQVAELLPKGPAGRYRVIFLSGDKHYAATFFEADGQRDRLSSWRSLVGLVEPVIEPDEATVADGTSLYVTAGGGGAYLSLTEDIPRQTIGTTSDEPPLPRQLRYPSTRAYRIRGFIGAWRSSALMAVLGPPYLLGSLVAYNIVSGHAEFDQLVDAVGNDSGIESDGFRRAVIHATDEGGFRDSVSPFAADIWPSASWLLTGLILAIALSLLARSGAPRVNPDPPRSKWFGWADRVLTVVRGPARGLSSVVLGTSHAVAHLLAFTGLTLVGLHAASRMPSGDGLDGLLQPAAYAGVLLFVGGFFGWVIFLVYLYVASWFEWNLNEASTAIMSPHHKNFVRLALRRDGAVVHIIGIDHADKRVSARDADGRPRPGVDGLVRDRKQTRVLQRLQIRLGPAEEQAGVQTHRTEVPERQPIDLVVTDSLDAVPAPPVAGPPRA